MNQDERDTEHEPTAHADDDALGDLDVHSESDAGAVTPEAAVSDSLRQALHAMREEADRIAGMSTGDEQVDAAEQFAEGANEFDSQIGAAARAGDNDRGA